ncbi:MAG: Uncharacterized protein G01um101413_509 [Parcubacteria group bacterium Gr01-1014_13]|nr:MAG: Uncharacterized protein G01um101413_509 [Parcubacteria group bacterium Gr01-1014_13]
MKDLNRLFKLPLYLIFLLGFIIFFIAVIPARAFEISPVKALFTIDQDISETMVIKIKNSEKNDLVFKLNVLGMRQDENGRPVFEKGIDAAESWVYPENNFVNIKSGETKSVNFIIKTPADTVAGSYYLGLTVEPVLEKSDQASLSARLVSLLTLQVKGLVKESVEIEKFESLKNIFTEKKLKFDLNLKNNGTIEVLMQGKIGIRNWRGEEIFSEPIILGNKLLAGSKRVLHPEIILKNNISLPGLYSAQVKINYGRTNQIVSAISYVWYFPKWSKIILAVMILFIGFLIFWRRKK